MGPVCKTFRIQINLKKGWKEKMFNVVEGPLKAKDSCITATASPLLCDKPYIWPYSDSDEYDFPFLILNIVRKQNISYNKYRGLVRAWLQSVWQPHYSHLQQRDKFFLISLGASIRLEPTGHTPLPSCSDSLAYDHTVIYIYIVCVCVCTCVYR